MMPHDFNVKMASQIRLMTAAKAVLSMGVVINLIGRFSRPF